MSDKTRVTVKLQAPATEMAQEEIIKQVAFLATGIHQVRFSDASTLEFDADAAGPRAR